MKWLKRILIGFLNLLLISLIVLSTISFNLKTLLADGIIKETIKQQVSVIPYESPNKNDIENLTQDERIKKVLENEKVNELIDKYLDLTINGMLDEKELENIEIEKDIFNFIEENKEVIEKETGIKITDEVINKAKEQLEGKELTKIYKQTLENTKKNLPEQAKVVLKGYDILVSNTTKIVLIILILIDLLFIALIEMSPYKFLKSLGISLIMSGVMITLMAIITNIIILAASSMTRLKIMPLLIQSLIYIIVGVFLIIIKCLIDSKLASKSKGVKQDEVSE